MAHQNLAGIRSGGYGPAPIIDNNGRLQIDDDKIVKALKLIIIDLTYIKDKINILEEKLEKISS